MELVHPKYGCSRQGARVRVSLASSVADLLGPYRLDKAKAAAPGAPATTTSVASMVGHLLGLPKVRVPQFHGAP